jgi:hypothetical protein
MSFGPKTVHHTGEVDARQRFKQRGPIYDSLFFIVPVLTVVGIVFCLRVYSAGGVSNLEATALVWIMASAVAVRSVVGCEDSGNSTSSCRNIAITLIDPWVTRHPSPSAGNWC